MLSNKLPEVSDQKESFLTLLWSSLVLRGSPAKLNFSFTWKSNLKRGSPSKSWGCYTILISCLLGGKIIFVFLTSVSKVRGRKIKKNKKNKIKKERVQKKRNQFGFGKILMSQMRLLQRHWEWGKNTLSLKSNWLKFRLKIFWHCCTPYCNIVLPEDLHLSEMR